MAKKIRINKKHRVCRSTGCKQVLSIYNLETHCHVHRQIALERQEPAELAAKH